MKATKIIKKIAKSFIFIIFGIILLVTGLVMAIYSPWVQQNLTDALVERMNANPDVEFRLDRLNIRFPLDIEVEGLLYVVSGDTLIKADEVVTSVSAMPLLAGEAQINGLAGRGLIYNMGNRDSLTALSLRGDTVMLHDASVKLSTMEINLNRGDLIGAEVSLWINPDTVSQDTTVTEPSSMAINVGEVNIRRFRYTMSLLPTIDSLGCAIDSGVIRNGKIDMFTQTISLGDISGCGLDATYLMPDSATIANIKPHAEAPEKSVPSMPWTIGVKNISFGKSSALYTTRGVEPLPGLDFGYIQADSVSLQVSDFYNQADSLNLPVRLRGHERCGIDLDLKGTLGISSSGLYFKDIDLTTPTSHLTAEGMMGMGEMTATPGIPLALKGDGYISMSDMALMFPVVTPYSKALSPEAKLDADIDLSGLSSSLDINTLDLKLEPVFKVSGEGYLSDLFAPSGLGGRVLFDGQVGAVGALKNLLLGKGSSINVPPMTLHGLVAINNGTYNGNVRVITRKGELKLKGDFNGRAERYNAHVSANDFPVEAFLPDMGIGRVTATIDAKGHGFSPFSKSTVIDANLDLKSFAMKDYTYESITADLKLKDGQTEIHALSADKAAPLTLEASGNLTGNTYIWNIAMDGNGIDLQTLGFATDKAVVSAKFNADLTVTPKSEDYNVNATISGVKFVQEFSTISFSDLNLSLRATDSLTRATATNRDLTLRFDAPAGINRLATDFGKAMILVDTAMARKTLDIDTLQRTLPRFDLAVKGGKNNLINDILSSSKSSIGSIDINLANDSTIHGSANINTYMSQSLKLDSISFNLQQDKNLMRFNGAIDNRPGTFDAWAKVRVGGYISGNQATIRLRQYNIKNESGFDLGLFAEMIDNTVKVKVMPLYPIINYHVWHVNRDNVISYDLLNGHIDANLRMTSDRSTAEIYTEHQEGIEGQEDLIIKLGDIHLSDWVALNPFMPPVKGNLSSDLRLNLSKGNITGKGYAQLTDFIYGKEKVGDFKADFDVSTNTSGQVRATADLFVNGSRTMSLSGVLNDSTEVDSTGHVSPFKLDFSMIHFPLTTVNPFLPPGMAKLSGMMNGTLKISGDSADPILNGYLNFDSTAVKLGLTGAEYKFSSVNIPVENSVVTIKGFKISGVNNNPLSIDGTVGLNKLSNPDINLLLNAHNMQLVNNNRLSKGASVYGKAFIDLDARVRGNMNFMRVNADLKLLGGTNVTYVMPDATSAIENFSTGDMVKFVNFADSGAVAQADSLTQSGMAMMLEALLTIENGTTVNVDLSADGKNKVSLQSNGTLDFSMTPVSEPRLSGQLIIDGGFVRYSPPVISEKYFTFNNGSSITFTGDMMNPMLNVSAVDVIKANVTKEGQDSRLVNFNVILSVTGTLNNMKVLFNLTTNDDITVQNELETMSADQRQNQAINLMLYNIYTGPGTKGDASLSGNPLMSFLASTANSWLANNVKGVDISLGVSQYDRTVAGTSSSTMSYSYQVSKSLFNDRFKIVVGGNYSTDANVDENFSQNLVNDISFEYFLNRNRTMYLRLFRHTGYESILEGEVTSTGVGFVYRHKMQHFKELFGKRKKKTATENNGVTFVNDSTTSTVPQSDTIHTVENPLENNDQKSSSPAK